MEKSEILNDLAPQAGYTEQQRLDYIKVNYPESYNFIQSLHNNQNNYKAY